MLQITRILVPVDIHENAAPVIRWAALLAQTTGSHLTLLHVNESLELLKNRPGLHGGGFPGADITIEKWRSAYEQTARPEPAHLAGHCRTGISVDTVLLAGRAHAAILAYREKTSCDLIVMGTHGRPWHQRLMLGSTAEGVLRASSVPVLVVHNTASSQPQPRLKRILLPTDLSSASAAGEEWARYLTTQGAEEVALVHTVENPLLDVYDPDQAEIDLRQVTEESRQYPPRSAQPFWKHAHQAAHAKLSLLRQQLLGEPYHVEQVEILIREGPAAQDILSVAERKSPDLVVMATHGRAAPRARQCDGESHPYGPVPSASRTEPRTVAMEHAPSLQGKNHSC